MMLQGLDDGEPPPDGQPPEPPETPDPGDDSSTKGTRRGHLKVVK